jgi:hypothetical protein
VGDAYFEADAINYDAAIGTLEVPFEQEPWDPDSGADSSSWELTKRTWWKREYRVPFLRCAVIVRNVVRVDGLDTFGRDDPFVLTAVAWNESREAVEIVAGSSVLLAVVRRFDVEQVVTDEVATWRRRSVGPGGGSLTWG